MNVAEVEEAIRVLRKACTDVGATAFNRFYFHGDSVQFNIDYQGYKTGAYMEGPTLVLNQSERRA